MNPETKFTLDAAPSKERISLRPPAAPVPVPHTHAKLDRWGIWLSTICAIHCMVMPIILISFPVMNWILWSQKTDIVILGGAALIGLGGCLLSLRHHRDLRPLCLVIAGLTLNGVGRFAGNQLGAFIAQPMVVAGPLVMAYGMWKDRRLCACSLSAH